MSDVVLCYPKTGFDLESLRSAPLSLLTIAATLVKEFDVRIIDQRLGRGWKRELKAELDSSPVCVGITAMTGSQISHALEMARFVRENNGHVKIIWGGPHPTLLPRQTLKNEFVDAVVIGEGDLSFREIVKALKSGKPLRGIKGIGFKENGKITITEGGNGADLDSLPEIPYSLVNIDDYTGDRGMATRAATRCFSFISSRGCPFNCSFCSVPRIYKGWRTADPKKVSRNLKDLVEKFGFDYITFNDENFFVDTDRSKAIASSIAGGFRWSVQARIDSIKKLDLDYYRGCGLDLMQIGVESGSERILKLMRKKVGVDDILEANENLAKSGIEVRYNMMIGVPTETIEDIHATTDLALKLIETNPNARIAGFYVYAPYPGTDMYELSIKEGFKPASELEDWAGISRQHMKSPWLLRYKSEIENIVLMSRFIDGKRLSHMNHYPLLNFLIESYGKVCRKRWKRRDFSTKTDLSLLKILTKHLFGGVFQ